MSMRSAAAVPQQGRNTRRLDEVLTVGLARGFRDNATISAGSSEEPAWLRQAADLLPRSDGEPAWFEEMKQDVKNKNAAFNAAVDERLQCEEELEAMKKHYIEATDQINQENSRVQEIQKELTRAEERLAEADAKVVKCSDDYDFLKIKEGKEIYATRAEKRNVREEQENSALLMKELRLLVNGIDVNMAATALANAIPRLVDLVRGGTEMQKVAAAKVLWAFSASSAANRKAIAAAGGIPPLVALVNNGTEKQKKAAVSALRGLAAGNDSNKRAIAAVGGGKYW